MRKFCERLDSKSIQSYNFLQNFRDLGMIKTNATKVRELTNSELKRYDELYDEEMNHRYEHNWRKVLERMLDYKRIQTVGDYNLGEDETDKVIMITAALLRPGKHQYVVQNSDHSYRSQARAFIAKPRTEPPLPQLSDNYKKQKRESLTKARSVFREFKEDNYMQQK